MQPAAGRATAQQAAPVVPGQATPPQGLPAAPGQAAQGAAAPPVPGQGTAGHGIPAQGTAGQGIPAQGTAGQGIPVQAGPAAPGAAPAGPGMQPGAAVPGQQVAVAHPAVPAQAQPVTPPAGTPVPAPAAQPLPAESATGQVPAATVPQQWPGADDTSGAGTPVPRANPAGTPAPGTPLPAGHTGAQPQRAAQPLPAESAADPNSTQGRAISVRTLGQGVPFARQAAQVQQPTATPPPHTPGGSGRRRKLGTPPDPAARPDAQPEQAARPHPAAEQHSLGGQVPVPQPSPGGQAPVPQPSLAGQSRPAPGTEGAGRSYAIGAPEPNSAEGPEPLDGPGGAVEVADTPRPQPLDDELPPEPLDNPRRLLVWPAPDVTTQQALSDRGYRPVIVQSREEVDAQIAAFPAALFVDPLTGPITRTALQSLRQAAVASEVPIMVTAGLGQASREAAYGADPAVLLKALAPRDSEQHPPRVLLIEEHAEIALALTATLERRGMQVARAASDADAVTLAGQLRPNLVVMDLMQVHRRRAGIVDWLRANGQLNRTPLVVYTAAVDQADLPRLASGETVLFLAERSTSAEVQARIVDLLARIGTN